ncbi:trimethyltridecatetraene synthase-like [Panicum virgatum]|nr:trimethyltridecatetraene synthase-like [Panicum virgatum]
MEVTRMLTMSMATAVMVTVVVILVLGSLGRPRRSQRKTLNLPPGPRGWPVFGSLLSLLADTLPPHRVLAALAARYGPLMHLRLGSFDVVVASSAEAARLVLKTHDLAFADRPPTAFGKILGYDYKGIVQTPYGPYWRMARKLCATELFSARRIDAFERARAQEMRALTRGLFERAGATVQVKEHLLSFTMRNILRMALGEKWSSGSCNSHDGGDGEAFRRSLKESFMVTGLLGNVGESVPWLGWLDAQGFVRRMKRVHAMFDRFNEQILNEHQNGRRRAGAGSEMDLVDVLLQLAEDGEEAAERPPETRLTRDGVKAFLLDIIGGGTETAAATLEWSVLELLRHPAAMAAATDALDRTVGRGRWVTETDLPELPYIEAVVKETMRLHPVGPLLIPHHAREDTVVGGYDVPAGARVLVNMWAVGRDPASWPEAPGAFRPERFLAGGSAEGVDVHGAHFQLLPFGSGRRMCPAHSLAMKEMVAALANLVQGFSWRLPDGVAPEEMSMEEFFGLNVSRKEPLVAIAEPRLPAHLYAAVDD